MPTSAETPTLSLRQRLVLRLLRVYPPYVGAGIRARRVGVGHYRVDMPLRFYNRNFVGTHYGGSLYSMCDPFFMLALMELLGPDYTVWDKAACIRYLSPARGRVRAEFEIPDDRLAEIRDLADSGEVVEPEFTVEILNEASEPVAIVTKTLHIRRKGPSREKNASTG